MSQRDHRHLISQRYLDRWSGNAGLRSWRGHHRWIGSAGRGHSHHRLRIWRTCWRHWNGIPVSAPKKAWFRESETRASLNKMYRWFEIQAVQVEFYSVLVEPRHQVLLDLIYDLQDVKHRTRRPRRIYRSMARRPLYSIPDFDIEPRGQGNTVRHWR